MSVPTIKYLHFLILVGFGLIFSSIAAADQLVPDLNKIFSEGDFRPYVPSVHEIQKKYGLGKRTTSANGLGWLIYKSDCNRSIVIVYDAEVSDAYVQEMIYTTEPRGIQSGTYLHLANLGLYGVHIGDGADATSLLHHYRTGRAPIVDKTFPYLEFNPNESDTELYVRYYLDNEKVVAISIGTTE